MDTYANHIWLPNLPVVSTESLDSRQLSNLYLDHPQLRQCASTIPSLVRQFKRTITRAAHSFIYSPHYSLGKRQHWLIKVSLVSHRENITLTFWDCHSDCTYFIACDTYLFIFLAFSADQKKSQSPNDPLVAINGSLIKTGGKMNTSLLLGQACSFIQEFHVADITEPILGADFFIANDLAINMAGHHFIEMANFTAILTKIACNATIHFWNSCTLSQCL